MTKEKFIIHKIVCDETNNTQKDIDNGVANVDIYGERIIALDKINVEFIVKKND